jgi:hypothetical protein
MCQGTIFCHTSKIYIFLIKAPPRSKKLIFSIFLQLYINSTKGWANPAFLEEKFSVVGF